MTFALKGFGRRRAAWRMVHRAEAEELATLSVSEIARRLLVNRSTLSRAFSAYYPYFTLRELLEMRKISKFDMLVMFNKVKTVKEALEILDIRDRNHFIKRGVAPPPYSRSARWRSFGPLSQMLVFIACFYRILIKDTKLPARGPRVSFVRNVEKAIKNGNVDLPKCMVFVTK